MKEQSISDGSLSCTLPNVLTIFREADLSCNHRVLGSQLGLSTSHLDEIESFPYHQRMIQILEKVDDIRGLSWPLLASALRKPALKEISAATYIECHCEFVRCSTASDSNSTLGPLSTRGSACSPARAASLVPTGKNLLMYYRWLIFNCEYLLIANCEFYPHSQLIDSQTKTCAYTTIRYGVDNRNYWIRNLA